MTRRTRLFLSVAVGVLILGLGTGLVASYVGVQNLLVIGGNGPAELAYVPADVRFVAYANVRDVMASEVRRKLSEFQPGPGTGAEQFKERTGIDIETDVDYLLAASTQGPEAATTGDAADLPLVLARGRFDPVRIEGLVREQGGVVEDYKSVRLLVHSENRLAVAFLEPGLAAIGTPEGVRRAIDTKASGADATGNSELMRLVRDVDDGDAWAVARFDEFASHSLPPELAKQLPPINWFSASGFISDGVRGQLRAEAKDDASAQNLLDVIRGFMALARLQGAQHPEMTEWLNSLQLTGEGKSVSLSFAVPAQVIDAIAAFRAARPRLPRPEAAPGAVPAPPAL